MLKCSKWRTDINFSLMKIWQSYTISLLSGESVWDKIVKHYLPEEI